MKERLSEYRIMWVVVFFDLPVGTKKEIKAATQFRNSLLKLGFEMYQFSVYIRCCMSREIAETNIKSVRGIVPPKGKVSILQITDKQYSDILNLWGESEKTAPPQVYQYSLF